MRVAFRLDASRSVGLGHLSRSSNLARALESRAYDPTAPRTALRPLRFRPVDWAWTVGTVLMTAAALWAR